MRSKVFSMCMIPALIPVIIQNNEESFSFISLCQQQESVSPTSMASKRFLSPIYFFNKSAKMPLNTTVENFGKWLKNLTERCVHVLSCRRADKANLSFSFINKGP